MKKIVFGWHLRSIHIAHRCGVVLMKHVLCTRELHGDGDDAVMWLIL